MNLEEFANSAAQTGILTHQETIDLFLHFTASNKPQLCFPTKPRQGLKTQVSEKQTRTHTHTQSYNKERLGWIYIMSFYYREAKTM